MILVKLGAITKKVPEGSIDWYIAAGWEIVKVDQTDSKETITTQSKVS